MKTLQNIKDKYYHDLAVNDTVRMGLDEYIRTYYIPCYDAQLNFLGYEENYNANA